VDLVSWFLAHAGMAALASIAESIDSLIRLPVREERGDGALFEITWHAVAVRLLLPMGL